MPGPAPVRPARPRAQAGMARVKPSGKRRGGSPGDDAQGGIEGRATKEPSRLGAPALAPPERTYAGRPRPGPAALTTFDLSRPLTPRPTCLIGLRRRAGWLVSTAWLARHRTHATPGKLPAYLAAPRTRQPSRLRQPPAPPEDLRLCAPCSRRVCPEQVRPGPSTFPGGFSTRTNRH